jgi:phosphopantothenoylcysteine synthetase/decarboxylase
LPSQSDFVKYGAKAKTTKVSQWHRQRTIPIASSCELETFWNSNANNGEEAGDDRDHHHDDDDDGDDDDDEYYLSKNPMNCTYGCIAQN